MVCVRMIKLTLFIVGVSVIAIVGGCSNNTSAGGKTETELRQAFKNSAAGTTKVSPEDHAAAQKAMQEYMAKQKGKPGIATQTATQR